MVHKPEKVSAEFWLAGTEPAECDLQVPPLWQSGKPVSRVQFGAAGAGVVDDVVVDVAVAVAVAVPRKTGFG